MLQCLKKLACDGTILCSLMFDEMSIRKHLEWNGEELEGFVDYGTHMSDDSLPVASEVLLFMVVCLNGSWKLPIGYFLCHGMSGDEKCNLVSEALVRLHDVNVEAVAVVCDGPATNFAVASKLGASVQANDMRPWFPHPSNPDKLVYLVFDACHMLKLLRNVLAEKGILTDKNDRQIRWQYIKDLYELQDREGLRAANKLKRNHIEWYQQKMKVSLAAQALSRSVASALEFVSKDLQLPQFADADATIEFIRVVDRLFDALNSKSCFAKEFKSVLKPTNEQFWRPFLIDAREYLLHLKLGSVGLHSTPRKTAVLGFAATITSVMGLYDAYVKDGPMRYLATYRLSQDHIELTFNVVRSRGHWNNNPTVGQFRGAYRQLLLKHTIQPTTTGNVVAQEDIVMLGTDSITSSTSVLSAVSTADILRSCSLHRESIEEADHSYCVVAENMLLTEFTSDVVKYMAGYVARKLCAKLSCGGCKSALLSADKLTSNCKLLNRKDKGGLVVPSESTVAVCTTTEKCIRVICASSTGQVPRQRNINLALQIAVMERTQHLTLFSDNTDHSCQLGPVHNHVVNLVRLTVNEYTKVRFFSIGKSITSSLRGKNLRFNSNKQVLFAHQ